MRRAAALPREVTLSTLFAGAIAAVYLVWAPPSTDLAAQTFRADLFADHGLVIWNNAWYSGHYTLGYSVIYPPLGALLGVRLAGALAALAAAALFAALAARRFGPAALLASLWFAFGVSTWLFTGRMTFILGVAVGLGALLAVDSRHLVWAAVLAAGTTLASPVAGLFLGLAGVAVALAGERERGAALALPAGGTILALNLLFPTTGEQPYPFSTWIAIPIAATAAILLVPREQRALRIGILLYAALATLVFIVPTPIGSNAARLGALFAGPLAALVLRDRPALLALLAMPLLYWQLNGPVEDLSKGLDDPSTERSFYAPLIAELDRLSVDGDPVRIEIPPTKNRWEAAYVAPEYPLARGWLRQLESDDFDLFTDGNLSPSSYREWLDDHAVSYVAIPDAERDHLARDEADLVAAAPDYLKPVWSNADWRLYRVEDAVPLASNGAELTAIGPDWFELDVPRPGRYEVAIEHTPYWRVADGEACVEEGEDGRTLIDARATDTIRVEARLLGDSCSG